MAQHEWYYAAGGNQVGPVGSDELKRLATSGELKPTDLVWRDGLADWMAASKVNGLFASPAVVAATTAPIDTAPAPAYAAPAPAAVLPYGGGGGGAYGGGGGGVTARAVDLLSQTRPWVLFLAILAFIVAGFMALAGIIMFFVGLAGSVNMRSAGPIGVLGAGAGLFYLVFALLYFVPALYLSRYASRIASLRGSGRVEDLEGALEAQKSFWRFVGIAVLVVICLYLVLFAVLIAAGAMT